MTFIHRDYTNKNSKGQHRLRRTTNTASIGLYFLFVSMALALALVVMR